MGPARGGGVGGVSKAENVACVNMGVAGGERVSTELLGLALVEEAALPFADGVGYRSG